MLSCGLFYQLFGKAEMQSWNTPEEKRVKEVQMVEVSDAAKAKQKEAQIKMWWNKIQTKMEPFIWSISFNQSIRIYDLLFLLFYLWLLFIV